MNVRLGTHAFVHVPGTYGVRCVGQAPSQNRTDTFADIVGVVPDIIVEPLPTSPSDKELENGSGRVTEADLKGALSNDRLSAEEKKLLDDENETLEKKAKRRKQDYQLSYALDILSGLSIYRDYK